MLLSALQHNKPLYSFEDNADYVYDVMWSPVHPALFACVDGMGRLDLWNLNNDTEVRRRRRAEGGRRGAGTDLNPVRAGSAATPSPTLLGVCGGARLPQGAGSPAAVAGRAGLPAPPSFPPASPGGGAAAPGYLSRVGRAGSGTPGRKPALISSRGAGSGRSLLPLSLCAYKPRPFGSFLGFFLLLFIYLPVSGTLWAPALAEAVTPRQPGHRPAAWTHSAGQPLASLPRPGVAWRWGGRLRVPSLLSLLQILWRF